MGEVNDLLDVEEATTEDDVFRVIVVGVMVVEVDCEVEPVGTLVRVDVSLPLLAVMVDVEVLDVVVEKFEDLVLCSDCVESTGAACDGAGI